MGAAFGAAQAKANAHELRSDRWRLSKKQSGDLTPATQRVLGRRFPRGRSTCFGRTASRGSHIVNFILGGFAAYRTQLFCYPERRAAARI